jgi:putative PEP-CTERM system histidine kinase
VSLDTLLPTLAAVSSLVLAAMALVGRPRRRVQWAFAGGMFAFAVEAMITLVLLTMGDTTAHPAAWLKASRIAALAAVVAWGTFVLALVDLQLPVLPRGWRIGRGAGLALTVASAGAVAEWPAFGVGALPWSDGGAMLLPPAQYAAMVELLLTVGILAALEACLRTSRHEDHRRVKYLVLGLGGIFLFRFYVLSQLLLFNVLTPTQLRTMCAALSVTNVLLAVPIGRAQLRGATLSVSRQMLYRSAVVGVLGVYLFAIGAVGSLLTYLSVPEQTFWASLIVFVSALGLTTLLLSDRLRWRVKRFIALHFYRSKYDYREQWVAFTKRLGSLVTAEEVGPALVEAVTQAVGTQTGAVYLETDDGRHRRRGSVGPCPFVAVLDATSAPVTHLREVTGPVRLDAAALATVAGASAPHTGVAVPLRWRRTLLGFVVLGPQHDGEDYGIEDFEFLATVAEQAAGAIASVRLSEAVAHTREMEAFDRVSAAVIHDIKNSVSALALLSRNAAKNFDDPEFRRDTITTLVRTVDRMKRLLGRLSSPMETVSLGTKRVDLADLLNEALSPLAAQTRVRLVRDIRPVGKVQGDRDALLRVVENLLTNAMEAIDGEGVLTARLYEQPGSVVIAISDTGCGIPEEFRQRFLFAPFRSTKKGGWGIGLYHTKQVVERHYGEITVESVEGQGTTFFVKLPLQDVHAGETVR